MIDKYHLAVSVMSFVVMVTFLVVYYLKGPPDSLNVTLS